MSRFEPKTFQDILTRMANRVVARTRLTDLEVGGVVHTILGGVARELDDVNFQQTNLQRVWDIDTAQGEDLDARGEDYPPDKLDRNGATKASTSVEFARTGTVGTATIPAGSIVRVPGGGPEFVTTVAGDIPDGFSTSALIGVLASEAGSAGNVDANTITQLDAITGVETVTNPSAATGGQDEETDVQFRNRIKEFLRSLPRGTPAALKFAALTAFDEDFGRVVSAEVVELTAPNLGIVEVYIDDGAGTVEVGFTTTTPETVVGGAIGGEVRLFLDNKPLIQGSAVTVTLNAGTLVEGVDFTLDRAQGQITLLPGPFPSGLAPADVVEAEYSWWGGLIGLTQKIINGDPADRTNFPGYRAAGTQVFVLPPVVLQQIVQGSVVIEDAFLGQSADVRAAVSDAINRYINGLGINGDVILSELIFQAQSVAGVADVVFTTPTANVIIGEGQLARVTAANIDIL